MTPHVDTPELTVVPPGAGEERSLGTIGVVFKLMGAQTNGLVSIVEHPFPVGACVPPARRRESPCRHRCAPC